MKQKKKKKPSLKKLTWGAPWRLSSAHFPSTNNIEEEEFMTYTADSIFICGQPNIHTPGRLLCDTAAIFVLFTSRFLWPKEGFDEKYG